MSLQCRWLGAVTPEVGVDAESVIPDEFENSLEVLAVESGEALSLFLDTEGANLRGVVPPDARMVGRVWSQLMQSRFVIVAVRPRFYLVCYQYNTPSAVCQPP